MDNGLIGEGRELNVCGNRSALSDDSLIAPALFLKFIIAHSMPGGKLVMDRELR